MFWDLQSHLILSVQFLQWQKEKALDQAALIYNPLWHLVFFLLKPSVTAVRFAIPINLSFHRAGIVIGVPPHDSGPALGHVVFL